MSFRKMNLKRSIYKTIKLFVEWERPSGNSVTPFTKELQRCALKGEKERKKERKKESLCTKERDEVGRGVSVRVLVQHGLPRVFIY